MQKYATASQKKAKWEIPVNMKYPTSTTKNIGLLGLKTIPEIQPGDNLPNIIWECMEREFGGFADRDIIVITSKIASKSLNLLLKLDDIKPSPKAIRISKKTGKDARWIQVIFDRGHEILAMIPLNGVLKKHIINSSEDPECGEQLRDSEKAMCITKGKDSRVHTCDAGVDASNHPTGVLSYLPDDPDEVANVIRKNIQKLTGEQVAVILADTEASKEKCFCVFFHGLSE